MLSIRDSVFLAWFRYLYEPCNKRNLSESVRATSPALWYVYQIDTWAKKAKQVSFKFDGIPKNNYFLIAFQDLNNNGKLDRDYWGVPEEPYGSYKKFEFAVQWDRDSFLLDKDFTEIKGDCYGKNMELRARLHRPQDLEKPVRYFLTGAGFSVSFT